MTTIASLPAYEPVCLGSPLQMPQLLEPRALHPRLLEMLFSAGMGRFNEAAGAGYWFGLFQCRSFPVQVVFSSVSGFLLSQLTV